MRKITAIHFLTALAFIALQACATGGDKAQYDLDSIQDYWWSDCEDAAVEFWINGSDYSGDFAGKFQVEVVNNILTFKDGLLNGHGIEVTHMPLSFAILSATGRRLVLRPVSGNPYVGDWELKSCGSMQPNNSFKPKPLRGSA